MRVLDTLRNLISGLGTTKDKSAANTFAFAQLDVVQLDAAHRGDWLSRKIIDIIPTDATREWRDWQAKQAQIEAIEKVEKQLGVQMKVAEGLQKARLYGGAALFMGMADATPELPLDPTKVKEGDLRYLHVLSRYEASVTELVRDVTSPFYGEPLAYQVQGANGTQVAVHPSRVIRFLGAPIANRQINPDGWGDSILQVVRDAVVNASSSQQYIAALIPEAKIDVIKVPGLSDYLATEAGTARVQARFANANLLKSMFNMLLIEGDGDSGESWEQKVINFSQFPELMNLFLQVAAGAADIPVTRLLGQAPAGLNATGDADIRNYYDNISSRQENELQPGLSRLDEVLLPSALGSRPPEIYYEWAPLWQLDEVQKANVAKTKAETTKIYSDSGLIDADALAQATANQLIEDGTYPGLEAAIDEFGLRPDEDEQAAEQEAAIAAAANMNQPGQPAKRAVNDAAPRTLYVSRKVLNAGDIIAWAKDQGFATTLPAADLHVTIAFSRDPIDWMKISSSDWGNDKDGKLTVPPGGARLVEPLGGKGAVVLLFTSSPLSWRHEDIKRAGASWDWPEFQPHIAITYDAAGPDLSKVTPYRGAIELGPEIFEEVSDAWETSSGD